MQIVMFFLLLIARLDMVVASDDAVQNFERDAKNRPVSKVIALLKDMTTQLEKEGEEDKEVYETMGCWCVTNEKSKTKSIADAETDIETLTASIESLTGLSAKLNTEIKKLEGEIAADTDALEKATEVREKELAEFTQEEKDSLVTINQLKAAVVALSKAHEASLTQEKTSKIGKVDDKKPVHSGPSPEFAKQMEAEAIRARMERVLYRHPYEFVTSFMQVNHNYLKPAQRQKILSFLQGASKPAQRRKFLSFLQDPTDDLPEHFSNDFGQSPSSAIDAWRANWKKVENYGHAQFLQTKHVAPEVHQHQVGSYADKIRDFAQAIEVDKEEHPAAFSVVSHSMEPAPVLPHEVQSLLSKVLKGVNTGLLESGMDDSDFSSLADNTQYEPASGAIFGVLKQMKENFETNLAQSQDAEVKASEEYAEMKAAKEKQIKASSDLVDTKKDELATTDDKNAQDKEIKEDTEASLASDTAFLADLKERCASMDAEFEERTKGRQLEIEAVTKALAFLNSDEAHDLFTRTFNPVLLQVDMKARSQLKALNKLKELALQSKDASLLRLAAQLKEGLHAGKVIKGLEGVTTSIGEMIDKLETDKKNEQKERDFCIEEINTNERAIGMKERDRDDLNAHIEDLKLTIATLDKEIEVLKTEIDEMEIEMKRAAENRKKEKAEFEVTVSDQRATQKLLAVSLKILSDFYNAALLQTGQKGQKSVAGQAPPPGFKKYEKSASSGGVMGMMQGIIDDAKAMEEECVRAEEKAQADFDKFNKDTLESIDTKTNDMTTKLADKAQAEEDKVQGDKDMEATLTELEALENEEYDIHKKCDFLLKNFDESQALRENEIEGLRQTNRIFGGAAALLQRGQAFTAFLQQQGVY